jgi:hypothetical protein
MLAQHQPDLVRQAGVAGERLHNFSGVSGSRQSGARSCISLPPWVVGSARAANDATPPKKFCR